MWNIPLVVWHGDLTMPKPREKSLRHYRFLQFKFKFHTSTVMQNMELWYEMKLFRAKSMVGSHRNYASDISREWQLIEN